MNTIKKTVALTLVSAFFIGTPGVVQASMTLIPDPTPVTTVPTVERVTAPEIVNTEKESDLFLGGESVPLGEVAPSGTPAGKATIADVASGIQCTDAGGGAGQRAISGALDRVGKSLGDAAKQGVTRTLGTIGNAATSIVYGLGSGAVSGAASGAAGAAQDAICDASGDSRVGRMVCNQVGGAVANVVGNTVNQVGSNLLNKGLSSIGIGSAGGLFGGVAGGLLGGGSAVPVSDSRVEKLQQEIKALSADTNAQTKQLVQSECGIKPALAKLAEKQRQKAIEQSLKKAKDAQITNLTGERQKANFAAKEAYIKQVADPKTRAELTELLTQEKNGSPKVNCETTDPIERLWNIGAQFECSASGRQAIAYSNYLQAGKLGEEALQAGLEAKYKPLGVCPAGGPAAGSNDIADCPQTFQVSLPAEDVAAIVQRSEQGIFDQVSAGIGDVASSMVEGLLDELFFEAQDAAESGIARLFNPRRNGASGKGSYFDTFNAPAPTIQDGKESLQVNITNSLYAESEFQNITRQILSALRGGSSIFSDLKICYTNLAKAPHGITEAEALQRANYASTTIDRIFAPQILVREQGITQSQATIETLNSLLDASNTARDAGSVNAASDAYNSLVASGATKTPADLQYLVDDASSLIPSLDLAEEDGSYQLDACQRLTSEGSTAP